MIEKNIENIVRAVILDGKNILFCKQKDEDYYFLPGGHIEFGESAEAAMKREVEEELGVALKNHSFIGAVENVFSDEGGPHHEINLVFRAELENNRVSALEDHLEFAWIDTGELGNKKIYPTSLKEALIKWLADGKMFWASQS